LGEGKGLRKEFGLTSGMVENVRGTVAWQSAN